MLPTGVLMSTHQVLSLSLTTTPYSWSRNSHILGLVKVTHVEALGTVFDKILNLHLGVLRTIQFVVFGSHPAVTHILRHGLHMSVLVRAVFPAIFLKMPATMGSSGNKPSSVPPLVGIGRDPASSISRTGMITVLGLLPTRIAQRGLQFPWIRP